MTIHFNTPVMADPREDLHPDRWCELARTERRELLVALLAAELEADLAAGVVTDVGVEFGPIGQEYDLVAVAETDVGRLRTPLWSHARATLYCDPSVHPANRERYDPGSAVREAADRLRARLAVPFSLESRGLTFSLPRQEGTERSWTAEHSLFRKRTAVVREDRIDGATDVDVRELLARFYTGPALRLVGEDGETFFLPGVPEVEGPTVVLCHACGHWSEGAAAVCPSCGSASVDVVVAARVPVR